MYTDFAEYWTLISDPADYAEEARHWRDALRSRLGPGRHQILELGVGGGNNLSHLTSDFDAVAADISPRMIEQARKLNPGVEFHVGDMRSIRLERTFKAVLVHDAIAYMLTADDLRATFATAAAHLEPGGVFITAPDWLRETFREPFVEHTTRSDGTVTFTHVEYTYDPDPTDAAIETLCWYLIREGADLRIEQDRHITGLFSLDVWLDLMREAGFDAEAVSCGCEDDPRQPYLLVGVLRGATAPWAEHA
jgi:SAM-dependent methyltransferase